MCPACGAAGSRPLFETADHRYVSCRTCGSGRLDPMPVFDPATLYSSGYFIGGTVAGGYADYGSDEPLHRRNSVDRLQRIARAGVLPPGKIIEIGAGYGFFLDEARRAGWEVAGTDVSAHARALAARLGLELRTELDREMGPADVLAAFQVLEHMADPLDALVGGIELIRPGGLLIAETWDRSHWMARLLGRHWQQASPPSVIHLFTGGGLRLLAGRAGFIDVETHPTPKYVSLGAVAGHLGINRPGLRPVLERARASSLATRPIKYGFGDLVTVTARKP